MSNYWPHAQLKMHKRLYEGINKLRQDVVYAEREAYRIRPHCGIRSTPGKSRRYQPPPPQLLRMRRSAANERERRRMNTLNVAYDK
ncbi:hypothetical protein TELCIR_17614, partial [Teladorsagia circumcincta]